MGLSAKYGWMELSFLYVISQLILIHTATAHRSSGKLIIDTAKKAFEEAISRQKRDTNYIKPSLESLLMSDPTNAHVVEFDLILDDDQYGTIKTFGDVNKQRHESIRQKRKAVRHSIYHWPGAEVPYKIDSSVDRVSSQARYRISKAMAHWQRYSCVKFVEYNPSKHTNYVIIQKGQWCASKLGMAGGAQPLYIALGCLDTGTVIHELGHALGWVHEQARPDRDDYVTIKWDLVSPSYKSQYVKHDNNMVNTYGVPYDYGSIMHYPSYGELITKDPLAQSKIGQRNRLSFNDIKLANAMYKCPARAGCSKYKLECINGGFVDHTCKCVCPDGDHKSCAVTNNVMKPYPSEPETTTLTQNACDPWTMYDNAYIPGYNEDVGFSLTIDECQTRCMQETMFKCKSFDYWKARRQCYLSSSTATELGIRLRRDSRMVHYMLNECPTKPNPPTKDQRVTEGRRGPSTDSPGKPITKNRKLTCPFEYTNTGQSCVRALGFPVRPVHIAEIECRRKLGISMWQMVPSELQSSDLASIIADGEEYWVKIENYRSKNRMAAFFDFCPYIAKIEGKMVLRDTLCYKSKGFFCQL